MNPTEREALAQEIFARVLRAGEVERAALVAEACGDDGELQEQVERLLSLVEESDGFLEPGTVAGVVERLVAEDEPSIELSLPETIGPYRIIRRLGEGGMGLVYEAEQAEPRRRIALKVLRSSLASGAARGRFRREAELLARLRHPGIAQVIEAGSDGGASAGPLPWFAMELVEGERITDHARQLDRESRLELMARVCDAVAHAHAEGIVHRDLKPDNVLVDDDGNPKVLDFGIARLAEGDGGTFATRTGDIVGTLAYMSPEQASGEAALVDARSDVYALGMLIHEVLTESLPHDIDGVPLIEALRRVRSFEFAGLGEGQGEAARDLDAIVSTALCPDRERRYPSAAELAADLRRHLRHEPVLARAPSLRYRLTRLARRHRALVAGAAGLVLVLALSTIVVSALLVQSRRLERQARQERYQVSVLAAGEALDSGRPDDARRWLDVSQPELRGWEWKYLDARLADGGVRFQVPGTSGWMAFAQGDRRLSSNWFSGVTWIDVATGAVERTLAAPEGAVMHRTSADGQRALAETPDVELLDLVAGSRRRLLPASRDVVTLEFASDVLWALVGEEDGPGTELLVFDEESGEQLGLLPDVPGDIWAAVTPLHGGVVAAAGGPPGVAVRLLELDSGALLELPGEHPVGRVVAWSPDGQRVLAEDGRGRSRAWSYPALEPLDWRDEGHESAILWLDFTPDGSRLVVTHADGQSRLLDGRDGSELARLCRSEVGERPPLARVSPDGRLAAAGGPRDAVHLFDLADGSLMRILPGHGQLLAGFVFSSDGALLATAAIDGHGRIWDLHDLDADLLLGHQSYVYDVSFSPDGRRLASSAWDGTVRLWDLASRRCLAVLPALGDPREGRVAFSPDGRFLASAHFNEVEIWDAATGRRISSFELEPDATPGGRPVMSLSWQPDGRRLAMGAIGRGVHVLELGDDEQFRLASWEMELLALAFSPDGKTLAGSSGPDVVLWDVATQRQLQVLSGHEELIRRVSWSPDGRRLASASDDGTVRVWSVDSGEPLRSLQGESGRAMAVAWSPDGRRLVTGGDGDVVRVWDLAVDHELLTMAGHGSYVHDLAFSPDGGLLASASGDGSVRLWDTSSPAAARDLRQAHRRLQDELRPLVDRWFAENGSREALVERLEMTSELDADQRQVALGLALTAGR